MSTRNKQNTRHNLRDMRAPLFECCLPLCEELMALVHGGDPGDCPRLVIEDLIGYVGRNARPAIPDTQVRRRS